MNSDALAPPGELPEEIGEAAESGEFDRVKAWLAGGTAAAPRSVNDVDGTGWTLLMWTTVSPGVSPAHIEFARYLISQGSEQGTLDRFDGSTALHLACGSIDRGEATAAMISMLVAAGATVNTRDDAGLTPLFCIEEVSVYTIDVVTTLLRAGASLDFQHQQGWTRSFEEAGRAPEYH